MRLDCYLVPISDGSGFIKLWVWVSQCGEIQYFYTIQILREINFRYSGIAKSAILTHLEALNFEFYAFLHLWKAEIYQINKNNSP